MISVWFKKSISHSFSFELKRFLFLSQFYLRSMHKEYFAANHWMIFAFLFWLFGKWASSQERLRNSACFEEKTGLSLFGIDEELSLVVSTGLAWLCLVFSWCFCIFVCLMIFSIFHFPYVYHISKCCLGYLLYFASELSPSPKFNQNFFPLFLVRVYIFMFLKGLNSLLYSDVLIWNETNIIVHNIR